METEYSVEITKIRTKICLSLKYNATNSFQYPNGTKCVNSKQKTLK